MSLTTELENPDSALSKFMATIMNPKAVEKFVQKWNAELRKRPAIRVDGVTQPDLVGMAFDYAFRWHVLGDAFDVTKTVAYMGAKILTLSDKRPYCDVLTIIADKAKEHHHLIPSTCIVLAWFEQLYRHESIPVPVAVAMSETGIEKSLMKQVPKPEMNDVRDLMNTIDLVWGSLIDNEMSLLLEFEPNPIIPNGKYVGGADGDWIWGGTLYDCKVSWKKSPLLENHLKQIVGYALLDWDNKLDLRGLGLYFARQRMIIEYPIHKLISDLADKRQQLKRILMTQEQANARREHKKKGKAALIGSLRGDAMMKELAMETLMKHHSLDFFDEDLDIIDDILDMDWE